MNKRYTGVCPKCQRRLGVDSSGTLNIHNGTVQYDRGGTRFCFGSRRLAVNGSVKVDETVPAYQFVWGQ